MSRLSVEVLLLILLVLWVTEPGVEGSMCFHRHFQTRFCSSEIVIRAEVLEEEKIPEIDLFLNSQAEYYRMKYKIKVIQMFKGSDKVNNLEYLYTQLSVQTNYADLHHGKIQYLISGRVKDDGTGEIEFCGFHDPWNNLSEEQKLHLEFNYLKSCECSIETCNRYFSPPPSSNECIWTENYMEETKASQQLCTKHTDGNCTWFAYRRQLAEIPSPQCKSE